MVAIYKLFMVHIMIRAKSAEQTLHVKSNATSGSLNSTLCPMMWRPPSRVLLVSPTARIYANCDVNTLNSLVLSLDIQVIFRLP